MTNEEKRHEMYTRQIQEIRTKFEENKVHNNMKFKEIMEGLKPQITTPHIIGFLVSIVVYSVSVMGYITTIKSDTRDNTTKIIGIEDNIHKKDLQYENIDLKLDKLLTKVAVLEATNKEK